MRQALFVTGAADRKDSKCSAHRPNSKLVRKEPQLSLCHPVMTHYIQSLRMVAFPLPVKWHPVLHGVAKRLSQLPHPERPLSLHIWHDSICLSSCCDMFLLGTHVNVINLTGRKKTCISQKSTEERMSEHSDPWDILVYLGRLTVGYSTREVTKKWEAIQVPQKNGKHCEKG